jgi:putative heme transporter
MAGLLLGIVLGTVVSGAAGNIWGRRSVAAFAVADRGWLVAAAGLTMLGYAANGQAVRGMAPHLITRRDAALLPYAGAAANRVLPAGTGGAAVTTRVLTRRGADLPSAVGIVVAAAVGTAIAGAALLTVAALLLATGAVRLSGIRVPLPHTPLAVIVAVVLIGLLAAAAPLALRWRRRTGRPARMIQWIHQATTHRPTGQMLARFVAFAVISRVTCIGVLVASTTAVGYPIDVGPAIVILVAAGVAGSLIPVAGGGGSVEVALAVALHAAGLPFAAAAAAALLSRIIGYWAPALAGLPALGLLAATQPASRAESVARHQRQLPPIRPPAPRSRRTVAPVGGVALGAALACATTAAVGIWG